MDENEITPEATEEVVAPEMTEEAAPAMEEAPAVEEAGEGEAA